jgi:hypothetical protein
LPGFEMIMSLERIYSTKNWSWYLVLVLVVLVCGSVFLPIRAPRCASRSSRSRKAVDVAGILTLARSQTLRALAFPPNVLSNVSATSRSNLLVTRENREAQAAARSIDVSVLVPQLAPRKAGSRIRVAGAGEQGRGAVRVILARLTAG